MTKKEINLLTAAFKKYLEIKSGHLRIVNVEIPEGFEDEDIKRKKLISELKKHIVSSKNLLKSPYLASSRIHRQIKEINEFSSDLQRLLDKHDLDIRTKFLLTQEKHSKVKPYYTKEEAGKLLDFNPRKIAEFCKAGTIIAEDWSKKNQDYEKNIKKGKKINANWRIPASSIFNSPHYLFEE